MSPLTRRGLVALLPFVVAFAAYASVYLYMDPATTGDEPHYLVYAHSLIDDGDVDLLDEYEEGDVALYYLSPTIDPHAYDYGDGRLISSHNVGLPLLIAPALLLGGGLGAVRLEFLLLSALFAHQLFGLLKDLGFGSGWVLWVVWAGFAFSFSVLLMSPLVYPDVPAALLVVVGGRALLRTPLSRASVGIIAVVAAALPWLHVRYLIVAVGFLAAAGFLLVRDARVGSLSGATRPRSGRVGRTAPRLALLLVPVGVSVFVLAALFADWYGSPLPGAAYDPAVADRPQICRGYCGVAGAITLPEYTLPSLYLGAIGGLFSPAFGLVPVAPMLWLGLAGLGSFARRSFGTFLWPFLILGGYFLLVAFYRPNPPVPGRFLLVVLPFVAASALSLVGGGGWLLRATMLALFGVTVVVSLVGVLNAGRLAANSIPLNGEPELPIIREVHEVWPVIPLVTQPTSFGGEAEDLQHQVGRLSADGIEGDPTLHASAGRDGPGFVALAGPQPGQILGGVAVAEGTYTAWVALRVKDPNAPPAEPVAVIDVVGSTDRILARRTVSARDGSEGTTVVALPFATSGTASIETRVYFLGEGDVWVESIRVKPRSISEDFSSRDPAEHSFPEWPKGVAWAVGTAVAAVFLARPRGRGKGAGHGRSERGTAPTEQVPVA